MFPDLASLLNFYKLHYLDSTPLIRPAPKRCEKVVAKYDFDGSVSMWGRGGGGRREGREGGGRGKVERRVGKEGRMEGRVDREGWKEGRGNEGG